MYLTGLAVVSAVFLIVHVYQRLRRPISQLPGPWISKWTDVVEKYYWLTGRRAYYVHRLHQQYGPVVRVTPNEVDFSDVAATKEIYTVKETYLKAPFYQNLSPPGATNVFSVSDVNLHRRYRRLLSGGMSESSLKTMYPTIQANVNLAIANMREEMAARGAADVFKWWLFMATDIIGELTFGESFRMLEQKRKNQYTLDLERQAAVGGLRAAFPSFRLLSKILPLPVFTNAVAVTTRSYRTAEEYLARHQRLELADPTGAKAKPTVFSKLYQAEASEQLTFLETRNNAMAYIVAGSDTTANTLTYLVWAVCRHPEIKARLVKELAGLPASGDEGGGFGDQELKQLPYLNGVIDETLRIWGAAASSLPRVVPAGGAWLAGYWLGEGTTVSSQAYSLHRDPVTFPRPEVFDPSRWEAPTKAMKDAFFAFGGGARACIGVHLARMELRLATAQFFRAFPDATVSDLEGMKDEDMEPTMYFLLSPKGKRCLVQAC